MFIKKLRKIWLKNKNKKAQNKPTNKVNTEILKTA